MLWITARVDHGACKSWRLWIAGLLSCRQPRKWRIAYTWPMRFTPQFLDEIRARLSVSQVVARKVALKKAGREYRGLSPFKVEKSPSFFVND